MFHLFIEPLFRACARRALMVTRVSKVALMVTRVSGPSVYRMQAGSLGGPLLDPCRPRHRARLMHARTRTNTRTRAHKHTHTPTHALAHARTRTSTHACLPLLHNPRPTHLTASAGSDARARHTRAHTHIPCWIRRARARTHTPGFVARINGVQSAPLCRTHASCFAACSRFVSSQPYLVLSPVLFYAHPHLSPPGKGLNSAD